jgi:peptidoglycan/LPS O-acetylase OafA/YrhL
VSTPVTTAIPPGWYPDPTGERQWRVWTGTAWSDATRSYGESVDVPRTTTALSLVLALRRVQNVGIVGILGGLGLLISVLAHWPGTAHPAPEWFAIVATIAAAILLALGTAVCAFGVKELEGHWSFAAFLPGMNLFVASALVNRRLGMRPTWRILSEIVLLVVFAVSSRDDLWLCIGPVIVTYLELTWFSALIDRLGPRPTGA